MYTAERLINVDKKLCAVTLIAFTESGMIYELSEKI